MHSWLLLAHVDRNVQGELNYFNTYKFSFLLYFVNFTWNIFIWFNAFVFCPASWSVDDSDHFKIVVDFFPPDTMTPVVILKPFLNNLLLINAFPPTPLGIMISGNKLNISGCFSTIVFLQGISVEILLVIINRIYLLVFHPDLTHRVETN